MILPKGIPKQQFSNLPKQSGVYLFKGKEGKVIYIGKAKSLRNRVRSYFQKNDQSLKTKEMLRKIFSLETIVVDSEAEALILEANLIKEHQPRFNVHMRDDKSYPYIRVSVEEPFPRVMITRTVKNDGSRYFGPYTSVGLMRKCLSVIKRLYTVRSCRYHLPSDTPRRPCLDYHLGLCLAPCVGHQDQQSYSDMIEEILQMLAGNTKSVQKKIQDLMKAAAKEQKFEQAAEYRDVLASLHILTQKQRVERLKKDNLDTIGFERRGGTAVVAVMQIRKGVLVSRNVRRLERLGDTSDEIVLERFISRYYWDESLKDRPSFPEQILIPFHPFDAPVVEKAIRSIAENDVRFIVPKQGAKKRLIELANDNAHHVISAKIPQETYWDNPQDGLIENTRDRLGLKALPRLMACVDISHHQGKETVGSIVVFQDGEPVKSEYRKMRVKGNHGNDDYLSMAEVVKRYLVRRLKEEKPLPDLFVLDGGKGQLSTIMSVLDDLDLRDLQLLTIAKKKEELFLPGIKESLILDRRDPVLRLFQRIRDEAHRFALSYSRKLRTKKLIHSQLADIPGLGVQRQLVLLNHFGSIRALKKVCPEDIEKVQGFSETLANRICTYLGASKED